MIAQDTVKNLENYLQSLEKNIKSFQDLKKIEQKGIQKNKVECNIPLEFFNYYVTVWKLEAMKIVAMDLKEIIFRQLEQERAEDNSRESFWKEY